MANSSSLPTVLSQAVQICASTGTLTQATITKASASNQDSAPHSIIVYSVPAGNDPDETNYVYSALTIGANATVVLNALGGAAISGGGTIQASCDTNAVVVLNISTFTTTI